MIPYRIITTTSLLIFLLGSIQLASAQISARMSLNKTAIASFLGVSEANVKAKLVFSNAGYLFYVDFSEATLTIRRMNNTNTSATATTSPATLPMISADGNWVIYAKGPQGDGLGTVPSSAYICKIGADSTPILAVKDSAYQPRFKINSDTLTVIYSTFDHDKAGWNGQGKTYQTKCPNGTPSNIQTVLFAGGSYFGGLSWDHKYLCSGQDKAVMVDIASSANVADTIHILKCKKTNQTDTLVSIQVCNPSISPSSVYKNAMMYFDFGLVSNAYSHPVMGRWGLHTRIFISNIHNQILKFWDVPVAVKSRIDLTGDSPAISAVQFANPEWSNHPYYSVAAITIDRWYNGPQYIKNEKIYLFNIKDSTSIELISTTDSSLTTTTHMAWPWFWTEVPITFTEATNWMPVKIDSCATTTGVKGSVRSHALQGGLFAFENGAVVSQNLIATVEIFGLDGVLITRINAKNQARVQIASTFKVLPGVYKIRVKDIAGNRQTMSLINIDR